MLSTGILLMASWCVSWVWLSVHRQLRATNIFFQHTELVYPQAIGYKKDFNSDYTQSTNGYICSCASLVFATFVGQPFRVYGIWNWSKSIRIRIQLDTKNINIFSTHEKKLCITYFIHIICTYILAKSPKDILYKQTYTQFLIIIS